MTEYVRSERAFVSIVPFSHVLVAIFEQTLLITMP